MDGNERMELIAELQKIYGEVRDFTYKCGGYRFLWFNLEGERQQLLDHLILVFNNVIDLTMKMKAPQPQLPQITKKELDFFFIKERNFDL